MWPRAGGEEHAVPDESNESKRRSIREEIARLFKRLRGEFVEDYGEVLGRLRGMSEEELKEVLPETTDRAVYDRLIEVVEDASRKNLKQAELRAKIEELGDVAVGIARLVPGLAQLFPG